MTLENGCSLTASKELGRGKKGAQTEHCGPVGLNPKVLNVQLVDDFK